MKSTLIAAAAAAAALAWGQGPEGFLRMGPRPDAAFKALDADGDGKVSGGEMQGAAASLAKLDRNSDGRLTEEEMRPNFGPGGPGGFEGRRGPEGFEGHGGPGGGRPEDLAETLMTFDRNGDGQLAKAEVPERMQNLFARADADQNGVLTKEELQKAASAQRAPGEGMMGPGGMMRMNPILAALDANHDGMIGAEEMAAAPAALRVLDKDEAGVLSQEEVRSNFGGRRPEGRGERF